ncbi:hypothetical protein VTO42DRAFT_6377 [Malbranchea cinnamomea]
MYGVSEFQRRREGAMLCQKPSPHSRMKSRFSRRSRHCAESRGLIGGGIFRAGGLPLGQCVVLGELFQDPELCINACHNTTILIVASSSTYYQLRTVLVFVVSMHLLVSCVRRRIDTIEWSRGRFDQSTVRSQWLASWHQQAGMQLPANQPAEIHDKNPCIS